MTSSDMTSEQPVESSATTFSDQTTVVPADNTTKTTESTGEAELGQEPVPMTHSSTTLVTSNPLVVSKDKEMGTGQSPPRDFDEHVPESAP
ncbi:hypothetical protein IWQ61_008502, partial [Dispira simplex]